MVFSNPSMVLLDTLVILSFLESTRVIFHLFDVFLQMYIVYVGLSHHSVKLRSIFYGSVKSDSVAGAGVFG